MTQKNSVKKNRRRLFWEIQTNALSWSIAEASVAEIDKLNILQASMLAMKRAVESLSELPELVLVDGNRNPEVQIECRAIVGGMRLSRLFLPLQYWPRYFGISKCWNFTNNIRSMVLIDTRDTPLNYTWKNFASMGQQKFTEEVLRLFSRHRILDNGNTKFVSFRNLA